MYKWLAGELGEDAAPKWNFHKYLIAKDGTIAGVFGPRTAPDDAAMNAEIDKALAR
jgi:glutathione peroxidase